MNAVIDYCWRANANILLWLNHWAASDRSLYKVLLFLTDEGADVITVATLMLMWFWPKRENDVHLISQAALPPRPEEGAAGKGGVAVMTRLRPKSSVAPALVAGRARLTQVESRAQTLIFAWAGIMSYVCARIIALSYNVNRPFASFLPVEGNPGAFDGLRAYGSFPSDHAALLGALPVAMFFWDKRLGIFWSVLGFSLAVVRVAIGFHYPADMLMGAVIGATMVLVPMRIYRREGRFYDRMNTLVSWFSLSNWPYCYFLYFFVGMAALEFAMHFKHVLEIVFTIRYELMHRWGLWF